MLFSIQKYTNNNYFIVSLISFISVIIWFSTQHIGYTSDSTTYLQLAEFLTFKRGSGSFLFFRTPGYPFLMILGGVPFVNSFIGLLFIQATMAFLIPILMYKILIILTSKKIAFYGTILSMLTTLHVSYSKCIMTEHAFIFTIMLLVYLTILYYKTHKINLLYISTSVLIFLTFLRPSANAVFFIIFPFLTFFCKKNYKHALYGCAIFILTTSMWSINVGLRVNPLLSGNLINRLSQSLFYHIYKKNTVTLKYINKDNGKYNLLMFDQISNFLDTYRDAWGLRTPKKYFLPFKEHPVKFIEQLYYNPNKYYFQLIQFAIDTTASTHKLSSNSLLRKVSLESILNKPFLLFSFIYDLATNSSISFAGQQFFYMSYVAAPNSLGHGSIEILPVFNPNLDYKKYTPYSYRLLEVIREFLDEYPQFWETREPYDIFAKYKGKPEQLITESIIKRPNIHTYWFMWNVVDTMLGPTETSSLFMHSAIENFYRAPQTLVLFLDNILGFYFGPVSTFNTGSRQTGLPSITSPYWWDDTLNPQLIDELKSGLRLTDVRSFMSIFDMYFGFSMLIFKFILFSTILLLCAFCLYSRFASIMYMLLALIIYQGLVVSVFAEPMFRYIAQILLIAIIVCMYCIHSASQHLSLFKKLLNMRDLKFAN